ncbi:hypothetical protein AJ88_02730 [Mesorhizobium amorphae CCBAU 01583]|nr:hypothetical protein AJ88_02730 [Mesorhizobium amorphae CCBAU 01583]
MSCISAALPKTALRHGKPRGAAIVVSYVAFIAIFDRAYFTDILPLLGDVYLPIRAPFIDNLENWPKVVLLLSAAIVIAMGGTRHVHWDTRILLTSALGLVIAFLLMGKGWPTMRCRWWRSRYLRQAFSSCGLVIFTRQGSCAGPR